MDFTRIWRAVMPPSIPSLLKCLRATGEDIMVDGGLCMAAESVFFLSLHRLKLLARGYDAITRVYAVIYYAVWIRGAGGLGMGCQWLARLALGEK